MSGELRGTPCRSCETHLSPYGDDFEGYVIPSRCPRSQVDGDALEAWDALARFKDGGVLPAPGAWDDQAAWWVAWVRVFEAEAARVAIEEAERQEKKARRAARGSQR